jgi:hypothetical protein
MTAPFCVVIFQYSPGCSRPFKVVHLFPAACRGSQQPERRKTGRRGVSVCMETARSIPNSLCLISALVEAAMTPSLEGIFTVQANRALRPDQRQKALNGGGRQEAHPPWSDAAVLARLERCCAVFRSVGIFNTFFR